MICQYALAGLRGGTRGYATLKDSTLNVSIHHNQKSSSNATQVHQEYRQNYKVDEDDCQYKIEPCPKDHGHWEKLCGRCYRYVALISNTMI